MEPIKPSNVKKVVPPEVIVAFNELISENWNGNYSIVFLNHAVKRIQEKIPNCDPCKSRYLDIEDIYRNVGWKVEYDSPGYNETYEAFFKFSINEYK